MHCINFKWYIRKHFLKKNRIGTNLIHLKKLTKPCPKNESCKQELRDPAHKRGKGMKRIFTKEEFQGANKHMKVVQSS